MKKALVLFVCALFIIFIWMAKSTDGNNKVNDFDIQISRTGDSEKSAPSKITVSERRLSSKLLEDDIVNSLQTVESDEEKNIKEALSVQQSAYDAAFKDFYEIHQLTSEEKKQLVKSYKKRMQLVNEYYFKEHHMDNYDSQGKLIPKKNMQLFVQATEEIDNHFSEEVEAFMSYKSFGDFSEIFLISREGNSTKIITSLPISVLKRTDVVEK